MDKQTRITVVGSLIWLIVIFIVMKNFSYFDLNGFLAIGVLPVVAALGYRFIRNAKNQ